MDSLADYDAKHWKEDASRKWWKNIDLDNEKYPVEPGEFDIWEEVQAWGKGWDDE